MTRLLRFTRYLLPILGGFAGLTLQLKSGGDGAETAISAAAGLTLGAFLQLLLSSLAALLSERPVSLSWTASERTLEQLERDKRLLLRSIKELEFDAKLGRIDAAEAASLSAPLRERATRLLKAIDQARVSEPATLDDEIEKAIASRLAPVPSPFADEGDAAADTHEAAREATAQQETTP